ncbi:MULTISPECIES: ATP-binding protein [unclassified Algoriphagus]|jgi:nitrogen fixation/metabolism regulation signal transduction histidine kinase|uniref:sensor histidine kinase n=2 Tax=Algoriphagus TaxID=246875 RepID=UPI000C63749C|nr:MULTISPECIES: ATP-binding protein [unclassified Algoriphagus]MAL13044.1 ATP-binding protein [Algoriphagus sp.]QYH39398.1 GHKL domain-containing protein [Algoriphagus sp. NBT04N3]HAS60090.1 ATP-binding protein [Algoriphagus sp.]HCB44880.1 ATP-binding protein [Algoriphagus sp.]HCH43391.1 ATP-binding protein [Algoriphagus sp.]|tara:strand:+ start:2402 stop:3745 length:1344 start_codon:yes stop_codon:yes gene_type:complete
MDYKVGLLGRIALLAGSLFFLAYTIIDEWGVFMISLFIIMVIIQIIFLLRYSESSFKKVRTFLDNIKQDKYSQVYPVKFDGTETDDLHIEFNAILAKLKEDQAEKEANYQYFRSVFKHLSIGLITFGENGEIQIMNTSAKRILNVDELKNVNQIENLNKELFLAIKSLRTGGSELIKIAHPDGIMQLSVYVIELLMRGEKFKLVSLQNIQSELEEKEMEAWQNLVKILTHEIMNSIAPISSLAGTLKGELENQLEKNEGLNPSDLEDYLMGITTIEKRSEGLISFVSDFRSLAHIPAPKFSSIRISNLFEQLETLLHHQIQAGEIHLIKEIDPEELILFGDQTQIEQVMINLTQNAIQAVEDSDEKIIRLRAFIDEAGKIIIEVCDTGKGIEEEALGKIFIPFFTTKKKGSGIGLSLSKQIMRRHKGNIQVRSTIGEGTVFKLIFNG